MDKRLLEQVQQAMQAQQDTIKRQEQMLDKKDRDIAQLTASLNKLARTRTQELERLPTLFKQLQNTMKEQTSVVDGWVKHWSNHVTTQATLINELLALGNVQIQLVEQLKTYQSTITPPDYLESDTTQLEGKLNKLANVQSGIEQSQVKITGSQTAIQAELKELSRLLNKPEP